MDDELEPKGDDMRDLFEVTDDDLDTDTDDLFEVSEEDVMGEEPEEEEADIYGQTPLEPKRRRRTTKTIPTTIYYPQYPTLGGIRGA